MSMPRYDFTFLCIKKLFFVGIYFLLNVQKKMENCGIEKTCKNEEIEKKKQFLCGWMSNNKIVFVGLIWDVLFTYGYGGRGGCFWFLII